MAVEIVSTGFETGGLHLVGGRGSGRYDPKPLPVRMVTRRRRGWIDRLDGRSPLARALRAKLDQLHAHVGGDPSVIEGDLMDRYIHVQMLIEGMEDQLRRGDPGFDLHAYLATLDRYRRIAEAVGLQRRTRDALSLQSVIAELSTPPQDKQEPSDAAGDSSAEGSP